MRKALLLTLTLACPAASQSVVRRDDGAIDFASLDQQALVPAPDPLLERAPTPASADEVAAAVNDAFLKDLMQLREVMLHVLVGLRWMVPTGHKVRARPRGGVARNRV